ncbi:MAG: thioredoxin family protein [Chromatiales bacterium]|nr:thioredoxin family protein [Chromatiales bacterium]
MKLVEDVVAEMKVDAEVMVEDLDTMVDRGVMIAPCTMFIDGEAVSTRQGADRTR